MRPFSEQYLNYNVSTFSTSQYALLQKYGEIGRSFLLQHAIAAGLLMKREKQDRPASEQRVIHHKGDNVERGAEERPFDRRLADEAVLLPPAQPDEKRTENVEPVANDKPHDPVEHGGNGNAQIGVKRPDFIFHMPSPP